MDDKIIKTWQLVGKYGRIIRTFKGTEKQADDYLTKVALNGFYGKHLVLKEKIEN